MKTVRIAKTKVNNVNSDVFDDLAELKARISDITKAQSDEFRAVKNYAKNTISDEMIKIQSEIKRIDAKIYENKQQAHKTVCSKFDEINRKIDRIQYNINEKLKKFQDFFDSIQNINECGEVDYDISEKVDKIIARETLKYIKELAKKGS